MSVPKEVETSALEIDLRSSFRYPTELPVLDSESSKHGIIRVSDRAYAAAEFRPFPTLLQSMFGITLSTVMLQAGERVIEVYSDMAQDVLKIPRKLAGIRELSRGLRRIEVKGLPRKRRCTMS